MRKSAKMSDSSEKQGCTDTKTKQFEMSESILNMCGDGQLVGNRALNLIHLIQHDCWFPKESLEA